MKISVITIFPEFFDSFQTTSIIKRAIENKKVEYNAKKEEVLEEIYKHVSFIK